MHTKTFDMENSLRELLTGVRAAFKGRKVNLAGTSKQWEATTATWLEGIRVRDSDTRSL